MDTKARKMDHIRICIEKDVECRALNWFKHVHLVHRALPEVDLDEVNTEVEVFGRKLSAPIIVAGMTGGHEESLPINEAIAEAVEELGLGMGVGSQRAAIEDESLAYTYAIVRDKAPNSLIIANLGVAQLVKGYGVEEARKAIDMISADAIAIHLNAAQELFQVEGDTKFKGCMKALTEVALSLERPVIVKETGCGISLEVASELSSTPISGIDVGGAGGTSWVLVEMYRLAERGRREMEKAASTFSCWGIPTPASIVECRIGAPDKLIIATGGVRSGLDAAKSIALGADVAGIALPVLKAARSRDEVRQYLERIVYELKAAMVLTGCRTISDLKRAPVVITGELREWLEQRGIDIRNYLYKWRTKD